MGPIICNYTYNYNILQMIIASKLYSCCVKKSSYGFRCSKAVNKVNQASPRGGGGAARSFTATYNQCNLSFRRQRLSMRAPFEIEYYLICDAVVSGCAVFVVFVVPMWCVTLAGGLRHDVTQSAVFE